MTSKFAPHLLAALLFVSVISLYFPVQNFEFLNFDDNIYVTQNPIVLKGLSWDGFYWAFNPRNGFDWHPLSWLSHMLDVAVFGVNAGASHLINVVFHALNVLLVFVLLRSTTLRLLPSLTVALIWGFSPLRVESVAWISERKDVLSCFFGLLSILAYSKRTGSGKLPYSFSVLFFLLSLLSKPTFITLPLLLVLWDYWPLGKSFEIRKALIDKIPFLILSTIEGVLAIVAQSNNGGLKSVTLGERLNVSLPGYIGYLGKLFWPFDLSVFYPKNLYPSGLAAGALITLVLISIVVMKCRKTRPYILVGWLWFIVALLTMIGLVSIGGQLLADRWSYLPHLGLIIALVWLFSDKFYALNSKLVYASAILIVGVFAVSTRIELGHWENSEILFTRALEISSNNFIAHTNLAAVYIERNSLAQAEMHGEEAVRLNPEYPDALNNLGTVRAFQGRLKEARFYFEKAVTFRPNFLVAQENLKQANQDIMKFGGQGN